MSLHAPTNRDYRVRLVRPADHPVLMMLNDDYSRIVVERSDGARKIFVASKYWEDSDAWAQRRWRESDRRNERLSDFEANMAFRLHMWLLVWRGSTVFGGAP